MSTPIRVLILEDQITDAELMARELRRAGFEPDWRCVQTRGEFERACDPPPDVILADYTLPQFDGLSALRLVLQRGLDIPFIIVSGSIGEDHAVAAIQEGANDYLLKDRLSRLGNAVWNALAQKKLREEKRRVDQALRDSEKRFRALVERSSDAIVLADPAGAILYASPGAARIVGLAPEQMLGRIAFAGFHPQDRKHAQRVFKQLLDKSGSSATGRLRLQHRDGAWRWVEGIVTNLLHEPSVRAVVINYRDITEHKQADDALTASEAELRSLFAAMTDIVLVLDAGGRYLQIAPTNPALLYKPPAELLGRTVQEVLPAPDAENILACIHRALEQRQPVRIEYSLTIGETPIWFDGTVSPIGEDKVFWIARDITERKRAEDEREKQKEILQKIFDHIPVMISFHDADGRIKLVNREWERIRGWSLADITNPNADILTESYPDTRELERVRRFIAEGKGEWADFKTRVRDGRILDTTWASVRLADETSVAIGQDVTARKQAEQALRNNEKRFRALIEHSSDGITLLNANGTLAYASDSTERILGYTTAEIIGRDPIALIHPDDQAAIADQLRRLIETPGQTITAQYRVRHKDGSWRWIESTINNLLTEPTIQALVFNYRDVSRHKLAEEQTQRHLARLDALRNIDLTISASLDLRLTLNVLLEQVVNQLHVDAAAILLLSSYSQILEFAAGRGFRTRHIERTRLRLGEGHAGQAALEHRIIGIPNLRATEINFIRAELLAGDHFITYYAAPLIVKGQTKGILEVFCRTQLEPDQEWLDFFQALAGQAAIAIDNAQLFNNLQRTNLELSLAYETTIEGWSRALDLRDKETEGHTQRVTEMSQSLARAMDVSDAELVHMRRGALLHDIGKLGVPDAILHKPSPLTDAEWQVMRRHPDYAYEMLLPISYLRPALDIPYCHHEKWDGSGYPRGLAGEEIPLSARIFAVVDVWDAITSDRPYRKALSVEQAREYIADQADKHFDRRVVEIFLKRIGARNNPSDAKN